MCFETMLNERKLLLICQFFLHLTTSFQLVLLYSVDICTSLTKLTNWAAYGIKLSTYFRYNFGNFLLWLRNDLKNFRFLSWLQVCVFLFLVCQSMTFFLFPVLSLCSAIIILVILEINISRTLYAVEQ